MPPHPLSAGAVGAGASGTARSLIARRFALFAPVLHKHHSGEDRAMWPLLAERGAHKGVLDALEAGLEAHLAHEERNGMALVSST